MQNTFPDFGASYSFSAFEEAIQKYWKNQKIFERILSTQNKRKQFGFYDGPPFATGLPHYGHILAGTIKDIVPRYWTMRGYHIERRFGWDTHGLPVEFEMEKTLNLSGSLAIRDYGIDKFNEACRGIVLRYTSEWRKTVERMGRWVDLDNDYKTMNPEFMETVWWVFAELWKKQLIYQGKKVVPYSWRLTAPLSNFEASQNYKSVQDPAVTVLLPLKENTKESIAIWTTTPWTLPANLAAAVHPEFTYVKAKLKQESKAGIEFVWILDERADAYAKEVDVTDEKVLGKTLVGKAYAPLFSYYVKERADSSFRIIAGEFVSKEDGTGIVHMAPAFGEDDFYACQKEGIELVDPTNLEGTYTSEVNNQDLNLEGKHVKDPETDKIIIKYLKDKGLLVKQDTLQHNYPFCERSDTPLIYKAISSWFVAIDPIKDKMLRHNQSIHWVPSHIKDGRFGRWLENARDWCISRNRFWGTPIPVWICENCQEKVVIGSREELNNLAKKEIPDLHSHHVDKIIADCSKCKTKNSLKRTPEVLDCWFESGSMPYAQAHYPFENKEAFAKNFPATFIAEGLDQTRGWFYTLTVLAAALFDKPAFKNCVVNGMVLAEDGKKMSKRLKNYPDPNFILDKYGADPLRLYLMQSKAMHGDELRFSEKFLVENMRAVLIPLWNAYQFFASYANIDGFSPKDVKDAPRIESRPKVDQWILALLQETENNIHQEMEKYELAQVFQPMAKFIDNLTNWYIRLNRSRYWENKGDRFSEDKLSAYTTLFTCLNGLAKMIAPFMPHMAEALHASLNLGIHPEKLPEQKNTPSIHEIVYEECKPLSKSQNTLISEMAIAQRAILLGRSLRNEAKIGVRQPLQKLTVAGVTPEEKLLLEEASPLILSELNLKELVFSQSGSGLVLETAKPNLKRLGARLGKKMREVQTALAQWTSKEIQAFEKTGTTTISGEELTLEDILIDRKAVEGKCAGSLEGLVAELDTQISEELRKEGLMREIMNRIQQRRKEEKFQLTDRIEVHYSATGDCAKILEEEKKSPGILSSETLTSSWIPKESISSDKEVFSEHGGSVLAFDLKVK
ncbi:MAG: isoleucine--tRNA ligase [Oligoflexia bacterium]|nr:isoleucine--tRNA ligase [Oligoflexia bacterium]